MNSSYIFSKRNAERMCIALFVVVSFLLWTSTGYAAYFQGGPSGGKSYGEGRPETNSEETASAPAPVKTETNQTVSQETAAGPAPAETAPTVSPKPAAELPPQQQ